MDRRDFKPPAIDRDRFARRPLTSEQPVQPRPKSAKPPVSQVAVTARPMTTSADPKTDSFPKSYLIMKRPFKEIMRSIDWSHHHIHGVGRVGLALLVVISFGAIQLLNPDHYYLTPQSQALLGEAPANLAKQLKYDAKAKQFQYNQQAVAAGAPDSPQAALAAAQKGSKVGGGAKNFATSIATDAQKGITLNDTTDQTGQVSIRLIPEFKARDGKQVSDRIVYPLVNQSGQLVYTVKANGLKEDLVIEESDGRDTRSFDYTLKLPASLEARLLSNGSIGIYSADQALFGNISYGSDADRAKVEAARTKSDKNNLVFMIPAPVIRQTGDGNDQVAASFKLDGDRLTLTAKNLTKASYPISIDPSVAVTSATSFGLGNQEGGIEFDATNNQLKRGSLTGGTIGAWHYTHGSSDLGTSNPSNLGFSTARAGHATIVYNGYIYVIGGAHATSDTACNPTNDAYCSDVQYAQLNPNGTVGSWAFTTSMPQVRSDMSFATYNGYIYIIGGNQGLPITSTTIYAKVNSDGTLGTWQTGAALVNYALSSSAEAYNGYLYVIGGCRFYDVNISPARCTVVSQSVQYAPIKADGSLGAWHYTSNSVDNSTTLTNALSTGRFGLGSAVYNGYIYVMGGCTATTAGIPACSASTSSVEYAALNADGTVGTWATLGNMAGSITQNARTAVYNGYLYVSGGATTNVTYASINADGTLGTWRTTSTFTSNRYGLTTVAYKGYVYILGGGNGGTNYNDVQYAPIDSEGVIGQYAAATNYTVTNYNGATVAYNGYLYQTGGQDGGVGFSNEVRYAAINSDGSLGSWLDSGSNIPVALMQHSVVIDNGYMYILGGCSSGNCTSYLSTVYSALINANGTTGAFTGTSGFTSARAGHSSLVYNGYIYVIGGCTAGTSGCTTVTTNVRYALICTVANGGQGGCAGTPGTGTAGKVGTWNDTAALPTTNVGYSHGSVVASGYIYVIGGTAIDGAVYYALICTGTNNGVGGCGATAGTVGTWNSATTMSTPSHAHKAFFYNGYIYVVGGVNPSNTKLSRTIYAKVNADGTLGSWSNTNSLTTARQIHGGTVYNGYIYIVGGFNSSSNPINSVEYAPINNGGNGALGSVIQTTNYGNGARSRTATAAYNGFLYTIGGFDDAPVTYNHVLYAEIKSDGLLGTWTSTTNFPVTIQETVAMVRDGYLYTAGGNGGTESVRYALICTGTNTTDGCTTSSAPGSIGTWGNPQTGGTLPQLPTNHEATVIGNYMYVMGGCTGSPCSVGNMQSFVYYAQFGNSGTLGAWLTANTYQTARQYYVSFHTDGYIYIAGGANETLATKYSDVQYAKVNSDGSLGTWQFANKLPDVRWGAVAASSNGYAYVIGGNNGLRQGGAYIASINANGTLGEWSFASVSFPTLCGCADQASAATYKGRIHMTGLLYDTGPDIDTISIGLKSISRSGRYSRMIDLGSDAVATKLLYRGTQQDESIRFRYRNAGNLTAVFGSLITSPVTKSNLLYSLAATELRYRQLTFELDDSKNAVFPDSDSYVTKLEDFELYQRAGSTQRLRGGKMLFNGEMRGLDAQPIQ
jgi:hypothetical protein